MHTHPYVYCTFAGKIDTTGKYARIYIDSLNLNHRNTEPLSDFSGSRTGASERLCTPLRITSTVKSFVCVCMYAKIYFGKAMSLMDTNIFFLTG